jgi:hypothetical protein
MYMYVPLVFQLNRSKVDGSHGSGALQRRRGHPPPITTILSSFDIALLTPEVHLTYIYIWLPILAATT